MRKKVIITDYVHPVLIENLQSAGYETDARFEITNDELYQIIPEYSGLILSTKILVTEKLLGNAPKLKFIGRVGSGMENIDIEAARKRNIAVVNSPEGNANAVAEHTLGMLLCLMNRIIRADSQIRNGVWQREENRGHELDGKTIGIIGYGHTGSAFAKKLRGFDVNILTYDKYKEGLTNQFVTQVSLKHLQEEADIISFHVPYHLDTHHYYNLDFDQRCKNLKWLINTSRGKVVNTKHLISSLSNNKLKGAALDVFEDERFYYADKDSQEIFNKLSSLDQVVLTPHIAGWTHESLYKLSLVLFEKLKNLKLT